jgi:glucosylceramidase
VMSAMQSAAPELDQLVAECAPTLTTFPIPEIVIGAMRNWASAVTLWNLALDPSGGPVQPPNTGCTACAGIATIDENTHTVVFNADYYQLGQIGKFVQPGASRISSNTFVSYYQSGTSVGVTTGLDDIAFLNPDGSRILVAYNNSPATTTFSVNWAGRAFTYSLWPWAMVTFRWSPDA